MTLGEELRKRVRKPDERTGPALFDREPVVLPDERKEAARKIKRKARDLRR